MGNEKKMGYDPSSTWFENYPNGTYLEMIKEKTNKVDKFHSIWETMGNLHWEPKRQESNYKEFVKGYVALLEKMKGKETSPEDVSVILFDPSKMKLEINEKDGTYTLTENKENGQYTKGAIAFTEDTTYVIYFAERDIYGNKQTVKTEVHIIPKKLNPLKVSEMGEEIIENASTIYKTKNMERYSKIKD